MAAFAVQIATVINPVPSTVRVRFAQAREAENYGKWLKRREPGRVVSYYVMPLPGSQANATFYNNKLWFWPDA